jgi:DNA-binding NarL/FixJ family response regulator
LFIGTVKGHRGTEAFAERSGRELEATGETARRRTVAPRDEQLTAQEAQIAGMARGGLSNPKIGVRLFINGRTVPVPPAQSAQQAGNGVA